MAELEACQQRCDILKRQVSSLEQELEIAKPISYESELKALKSRVQGALEQVTTWRLDPSSPPWPCTT